MNVKKTENLFKCEFRLSKSSFQFLETTEASSHNKSITTNVSLIRQLPAPAACWDRSPMLTASLLRPGSRGRLCVSAWPADRMLPRQGTAIPLLKQVRVGVTALLAACPGPAGGRLPSLHAVGLPAQEPQGRGSSGRAADAREPHPQVWSGRHHQVPTIS